MTKILNCFNPNIQKPSFKGNYLVDTGAGNSREFSGNVSGKGETDSLEKVSLDSTPIKKAFSSEEFITNWSNIVATMIPKEDKNVKIFAAMPGPSKLNNNGEQEVILSNIDKFKFTPEQLKQGMEKAGVTVEKLKIFNDGHAHNINILKNYRNIISNPQFVGGLNVFPGGGCGCATFRKSGGDFVSVAEQRASEIYPKHMLNLKLLTDDMLPRSSRLGVGEYSSNIPSAIRNFAKDLGFNDQQTKILYGTKEGRIVTQYIINLDLSDGEQKIQSEMLEKTGMFKKLGKENNTQYYVLLKPDKSREIFENEHSKALKTSGIEFFKGIGIILSRFETQNMGTDVFIPTKFASKLDEALTEQGINPVKIVQQTAWDNLNEANRKNVVKNPENQRVFIKDLGDPCSIENIKLLLTGKSPEGDGFREIEIPIANK